jgi:NAD(P)-dependent dehydrogenase (short-subunit alcohol dehydrogenase family)
MGRFGRPEEVADGVLYLARQFMNTNGWFWSCVPLENAQADDRMLQTMMDGAA